ncbi:hypothetical protein Droror1_Dr00020029 [Drosera rotundifolia]
MKTKLGETARMDGGKDDGKPVDLVDDKPRKEKSIEKSIRGESAPQNKKSSALKESLPELKQAVKSIEIRDVGNEKVIGKDHQNSGNDCIEAKRGEKNPVKQPLGESDSSSSFAVLADAVKVRG